MAGERDITDGSIALRSYGSMSYAGLLSFIYADDVMIPIKAVTEWLNQHYTISVNPGMGQQGLLILHYGKSSFIERD